MGIPKKLLNNSLSSVPEGITGEAHTYDTGTSKAAADSVDATLLMEMIYVVMESFGEAGCISDEVEAALPQFKSHSITPRFAQMVRLGMIWKLV